MSCSVQRTAVAESSALRVESSESVQKVDSVVVEVRDTLREVTTIMIDRNDKGDTLKVVQITDRERLSSKADVRRQKEDVRVVRDTVYIERKDSVSVQEFKGSNGSSEKKSGFLTYVKWIFALICAIVVLIITVKVCLRRSLL